MSVVSAQQNQGGNNQSNNNNNNNQGSLNFKATPELDSLALFGAGLLGAAGYAIVRYRARR